MNNFLKPESLEALWVMLIAFLPNLLAAALILLVFWIIYKVMAKPLSALLGRSEMDDTLIRLLTDSIFRFLLLFVAVVMAAGQVGINVGAALAGLGVAGIAVGFAAQDSIANTISGFMIFWDKPFRVSEWITVGDQYGKVSDITLRTTRIRTPQNTYVVIPNKNIIDDVLVNHSKQGELRIDLPVGIAYKENIPQAREVLLAAVNKVAHVLERPAADVVVDALGDSSVNLLVRVWIDNADDEMDVTVNTLEACKLGLDSANIEIPFPHLQLFVDEIKDKAEESLRGLR
jgi:small conductance mechanosensitive channel